MAVGQYQSQVFSKHTDVRLQIPAGRTIPPQVAWVCPI